MTLWPTWSYREGVPGGRAGGGGEGNLQDGKGVLGHLCNSGWAQIIKMKMENEHQEAGEGPGRWLHP